jgi:hypothetical protein
MSLNEAVATTEDQSAHVLIIFPVTGLYVWIIDLPIVGGVFDSSAR